MSVEGIHENPDFGTHNFIDRLRMWRVFGSYFILDVRTDVTLTGCPCRAFAENRVDGYAEFRVGRGA